ncbi:hypothetical protein SU45_11190, partial [Brachyspira hyodysenteriae]
NKSEESSSEPITEEHKEEASSQVEEPKEEKPELTNDYISKLHDEYLHNQELNNNQEPSNDDDYISKFKKMNEEYVESTKKEE